MTDKEEIEQLRACNETLRRIVFEYRARAHEVVRADCLDLATEIERLHSSTDIEGLADALEKADWSGVSIGNKVMLKGAIEILRSVAPAQALPPSANDRPGESRNGGSTPSGGASTVAQTQREIERLRKALELLADELPEEMHTLDEPDEHWEVIVKMRTIAREALSSEHRG